MTIQDLKYLKDNSIENSFKFHFPFKYVKTNIGDNEPLNCNIFDSATSLNKQSRRNEEKNNFVLNNVFTIHILNVFFKDLLNLNYVFSVYANDTLMDSVSINQNSNLNVFGREYEKILKTPLAKVSELSFKLTDFDDNVIKLKESGNDSTGTIPSNSKINSNTDSDLKLDLDGNVCVLIRLYESHTYFNDNYNDLNPQYDPNMHALDLDENSSSEEED